jgi:Skp family chaperone for outer membrane proteins
MNKNKWIILGFAVQLALIAWVYFMPKGRSAELEVASAPVASAFQDTSHIKPTIVAYINGDSINEKYQFIVDKSALLEKSLQGADAKFQNEYAKREKEAQDLMSYANSKQLPDDEARTVQERLATLQAELEQIDQKMSNEIATKKKVMLDELNTRVERYLERYAKSKNIDFVLNYQSGVPMVMYGNAAYNVTAEVLAGLNAEYQAEKEK